MPTLSRRAQRQDLRTSSDDEVDNGHPHHDKRKLFRFLRRRRRRAPGGSTSGEAKDTAMTAAKPASPAPETLCSVCLCSAEETPGQAFRELSCEHTFHEECLAPWLTSHNTCPMCRKLVKTAQEVEFVASCQVTVSRLSFLSKLSIRFARKNCDRRARCMAIVDVKSDGVSLRKQTRSIFPRSTPKYQTVFDLEPERISTFTVRNNVLVLCYRVTGIPRLYEMLAVRFDTVHDCCSTFYSLKSAMPANHGTTLE